MAPECPCFVRVSLKEVPEIQQLRFAAGVVFGEKCSKDYDKMLEAAEMLCLSHSTDAVDAVVFQEGDKVPVQSGMRLNGIIPDGVSMEATEMNSELTDQEKDVALECMSILLKADAYTDPMEKVFENLGSYYGADRLYILAFSKRIKAQPFFRSGAGKEKLSSVIPSMESTWRISLFLRAALQAESRCFCLSRWKRAGKRQKTEGMECGNSSFPR